MNINFEYYKIFYIIAKNKNITKAAEELNISQPAISRMLKTMEEQMYTKLFLRKTKGVSLTQEGKELYRLIGNEIDNIIKAENSFSKIINEDSLKIAINKTYLNYLINNKTLNSILTNNSNITFLNTENFDLLNNQLSNNLIDFAVISEPTNYQFNNEIKFKKIDELHLIFVSKNSNISNIPIVLSKNNKLKQLSEDYIKHNNVNFNNTILVDDYDNIFPLINNGYANGFLIKELITNELKDKSVYEIKLSTSSPIINIGILYNANNELKIQKYFDIKK